MLILNAIWGKKKISPVVKLMTKDPRVQILITKMICYEAQTHYMYWTQTHGYGYGHGHNIGQRPNTTWTQTLNTGNWNHRTLNALNHNYMSLYAEFSDLVHPKEIVESHTQRNILISPYSIFQCRMKIKNIGASLC